MHWRRVLLSTALLAALAGLSPMPGASGQGLLDRLRANRQRTQAVQQRLRELKAEQATRRNQLSAAQRQAAAARSAYDAAKEDLAATQGRLRAARREYKNCVVRVKKHDAAVQQRIRALYEIGEPSYLEVLLNATTFSDFVERADYMKRITRQDTNLLVQYVNDRKAAQALRDRLAVEEARERDQTAKLYRKKSEYAAQAAEAGRLLARASSDRAAAEQQLEELERNSNEIAEMLRRIQSGGSSSGESYSGAWTGWGSQPIHGGYRFSSGFGWRIHPITGRQSFHDGVDMACGYGASIHAAANGLVVHAGWYGAYGECVIIDHGSGWGTLYGHCSSLAVSAGQTVSAGQVIGAVGSTGFSTGPHLHYSVRRYGSPVSPF